MTSNEAANDLRSINFNPRASDITDTLDACEKLIDDLIDALATAESRIESLEEDVTSLEEQVAELEKED